MLGATVTDALIAAAAGGGAVLGLGLCLRRLTVTAAPPHRPPLEGQMGVSLRERAPLHGPARGQNYLYVLVGILVGCGGLLLALSYSPLAGAAAAVLVLLSWLLRARRRPQPDIVVDQSLLRKALNPRLVAELTELERQARQSAADAATEKHS